MNLTLHLTADTEALLVAQVRVTGKDAETLALDALREKLAVDEGSTMLPRDQWNARFNAMIAAMPEGNPAADFSRESIYNGRGE
jgi:hypothetical protein